MNQDDNVLENSVYDSENSNSTETDTTTTVSNSEDISVDGNEAAVLESLPDKDIVMNFYSIEDLCSTWKNRVDSLNLTSERVTTSFKAFTSYGILENYIVCLSTAINSLVSAVNQVSNSINNTKNSQADIDSFYSGYSGSGSYNYNSNDSYNSFDTFGTIIDNNENDTTIDSADVIAQLTLQDYTTLSTILSSIASSNNIDLDSLVNDDVRIEEVKNEMLNSPNISDELKEIIQNMDSTVLKEVLNSSISNGNVGIVESESVSFLQKYLTKVASMNNTTVSALLADEEGTEALHDSINDYNKAIEYIESISSKGETFARNELFNIYDGNSVSDTDSGMMSSIRTAIDIIASDNNMTSEELLNGDITKYISTITSSKAFVSNLSQSSTSSVKNTISSILN